MSSVLADERAQLTRVLSGLNNLGSVATRVIAATQQNTVADLRALQPILGQLAKAGKDLPNALELLTTYPFPRTVAGPRGGIRGDYANLFVTADSSVNNLINNLTSGGLPPLPLPGGTPKTPLPKPTLPVAPPRLPLLSGLDLATDAGSQDLARMLVGGLS